MHLSRHRRPKGARNTKKLQTKRDQAKRGQATRDQTKRGQTTRDQATRDQAQPTQALSRRRCLNDEEIGKTCSTGQYSYFKGNFYKDPANIAKFKAVGEKFHQMKAYKRWKTSQEKYTNFLHDQFDPKQDTKQNLLLMRNDFYTYINETWFKENDIENAPKTYYVQHDDFRKKQEEVYYQLIEYTQAYIKANAKDQTAIAIQNVYTALTQNTQRKFKIHARLVLKEVESLLLKDEVYALLGNINSNEIVSSSAPVQWVSGADEKDVTKYLSHLYPVELGLYDRLLYLEPDATTDQPEALAYKKAVKRKYLAYIGEVFAACLGPVEGAKYLPEHIWSVEVELLTAMYCHDHGLSKADAEGAADGYNMYSAKELLDKYELDWPALAKYIGFAPHNVPKKVMVSAPSALKCTMRLLKTRWNSPEWKTYWLFIQFKQMIRFEVSLREIHYRFYDQFLQGQPAIMPKEIYAVFGLSMHFNYFLSQQYIQRNYNALYVNYVQHLTADLKTLFINKIKRNSWLSPSTKQAALKKLDKLQIQVGVPKKLEKDPVFAYQADDSLANIGQITRWKHKQAVKLEGQPMIDAPRIDWTKFKLSGTQCYVVNAYYTPVSNSIYVPLAYIQKPFIDLDERGLEYNLVYIGYTLGHELSHALDDTGSRFDENGNLHNWWTPADRKVFQSKVDDVIKQYEVFAKRDGHIFDATSSAGEDLADISGFALVEEYLMDHQVINDDDVKVKKLKLANFYVNLAVQGRQLVYKNAVKAQLKINPHPLEKYRLNCPLSRLALFRTIFGVKKGDGMWWKNMDTIW